MEIFATCGAVVQCFNEQALYGTANGVIHISSLIFSLCYSLVSFEASQGHEIKIPGTVSLLK